MNTEWSKTTKQIVGVGLTIFGLYILYISRSMLYLIIIAALISFLLMPIVNFFNQQCRLPRGLAILFAYLIATIIILLAPLVLVPPIIDGVRFFTGIDYQVLFENSLQWSEDSLLRLKEVDPRAFGVNINLDSIIDPALAHKFYDRFLNIVPIAQRKEVAILLNRLNKIWRSYLRGQLYLMIIIGSVTGIGLSVLGVPGAFTLGVIAGILELFPYVGPVLAAIPAVIVALIQGSTSLGVSNWVFALIIIGFYILVQQFENVFVVPRVLGGAVDLHPLVVMIGVLVGASVAGILGALLAAPVIASGREIVRYLYLKTLGEDPYPPNQEEETDIVKVSWLEQSKNLVIKLRQLTAGQGNSSSPAMQETPSQNPKDS
jgi:predicted PurR-regulated permease PerM